MRPLVASGSLLLLVALVLAVVCTTMIDASSILSSSSSSSSSTTSTIRLRTTTTTGARLGRRPESCRENLPRKSEDLPGLVIVGQVKEIYNPPQQQQQQPAGEQPPSDQAQQVDSPSSSSSSSKQSALVSVGRVIRGNRQLVGADLIVSGFNSSSPCPNYIRPNDTLILLLSAPSSPSSSSNQTGGNGAPDPMHQLSSSSFKYSLASLLPMNLNNLERINAIAADEPYKRRGPIEDILCEAHYCPYGRCVVAMGPGLGRSGGQQPGSVSCQCPSECPPSDEQFPLLATPVPVPVCGSDNVTYATECHLVREGCRRQRPLFVTKESAC